MLKNTFKLIKHAASKSLIIIKIFEVKILKFLLCYWILSLWATLLLMLLLNYYFMEKQNVKKIQFHLLAPMISKQPLYVIINNSNLSVSFYNIGQKIKLLRAVFKVRILRGASHVFGSWQIILMLT